jgi:hypothetical protein
MELAGMTQEHPITPPPDLILEWCRGWNCTAELAALKGVATQAARWGADQELEACREWLSVPCPSYGRELRNARRPKPLSLKEQALAELELLRGDANAHGLGFDAPAIRRALESLPD